MYFYAKNHEQLPLLQTSIPLLRTPNCGPEGVCSSDREIAYIVLQGKIKKISFKMLGFQLIFLREHSNRMLATRDLTLNP